VGVVLVVLVLVFFLFLLLLSLFLFLFLFFFLLLFLSSLLVFLFLLLFFLGVAVLVLVIFLVVHNLSPLTRSPLLLAAVGGYIHIYIIFISCGKPNAIKQKTTIWGWLIQPIKMVIGWMVYGMKFTTITNIDVENQPQSPCVKKNPGKH
jgi:glucan phosphoethanolaminetransferase (alkaline phosphatase superfamily)